MVRTITSEAAGQRASGCSADRVTIVATAIKQCSSLLN